MIVSNTIINICLAIICLTFGLMFGFIFSRKKKPDKRKKIFWFTFACAAFLCFTVTASFINNLPQITIVNANGDYTMEYLIGNGKYNGHTLDKDGQYLVNNTSHTIYEVEIIYEPYEVTKHVVRHKSSAPAFSLDVHAVERGSTTELPVGKITRLRDFPKGILTRVNDTIKNISAFGPLNEIRYFYISSEAKPSVKINPRKKYTTQ